MKIIDYTTVNDTTIKEYLEKGWQPYGSPMLSVETDEVIQAVVKYEEPPKTVEELNKAIDHTLERPVGDPINRDDWIADRLGQYQQFWNEKDQRYHVDHDWTPTREELLADIERSWEFEEGGETS